MQSWFARPIFPASVVSLIAFIVYLFTMDPGVGYIDSGELATVCHELGIAHPTGYPLFTLIGWLFSHLPIPVSVILRLNIMAALFTALASGAVVLLVHELIEFWQAPKRQVGEQKGKKQVIERSPVQADSRLTGIPLYTGVIAAFSLTWWQQATSLEVYSLHILLITLALYFFLRMLRLEDVSVGRNGLLFAITLGLAFTNHLTTILLAPGMLYAFFARYKGKGVSKIGKLALPFAACLLVYLYLPLRAATDPILNWGDPSEWSLFWKHVTGGQYKIWMFTGNSAGANWSMFWSGLADQFSLPVCLLAIAGLPALLRRKVQGVNLLVFFLLLFFGCLLYAINYDINDIQSYFLLSYLVIIVMAAFGLEWIACQLPGDKREKVLAFVFPALLGLIIATNWEQADESENYLVEDYTKNLLTNLPQNAIIFSTQWDFWVSAALYYQTVEGLRPDVLVIDKHLLRDRPWYFSHLKQRNPEVMQRVETEANAFLQHLNKFDRDEPFDQMAIGPAYQALTTALIAKNPDRPVFMTAEMAEERDELFAPQYKPSSGGVALGLANTTIPIAAPKITHRATSYEKRGYYPDNTRRLQALPLSLTASNLASSGDRDLARQYYDLALQFKPKTSDEYDGLTMKEQDFARTTDAFFAQVEQMRAQLNAPAR